MSLDIKIKINGEERKIDTQIKEEKSEKDSVQNITIKPENYVPENKKDVEGLDYIAE